MEHKKLFVKQFILGALFSLFVPTSYAEPPKEVIQSCHLEKATDPAIKFTKLSVVYNYDKEKITSCPEDPDGGIIGVETNNRFFYQEHCGSQEYFLSGNRKFNLEHSINNSLSLEIEPYGVVNISNWYLISYSNINYICMTSPVGPNGWSAATSQYYLIENAFDDTQPLKAYFYFFDKKFIDKVRARGWTNG